MSSRSTTSPHRGSAEQLPWGHLFLAGFAGAWAAAFGTTGQAGLACAIIALIFLLVFLFKKT